MPSPLSIVVFSSDPRIRSDTDFGRGVTQPGASWTGGVQVADISAAGQGAATQVNLATRCPGATRLTPQRPRPPRYFDQRSHDIRTIPAEDRAARALRTTRLRGTPQRSSFERNTATPSRVGVPAVAHLYAEVERFWPRSVWLMDPSRSPASERRAIGSTLANHVSRELPGRR